MQNPAAAAMLAKSLLPLADADWSEWEIGFLEAMCVGSEPLSTRQGEKLVELRDDAKSSSKFDGFSVGRLVQSCWTGRLDLLEDDEAFIVGLKAQGTTKLKRRALMRLLRCARELGLLTGYVDIDRAA
jgi:hypothetical protein